MTQPVSPARSHRLAARMTAPVLAAARACGLDVTRLLADAGIDVQLAHKRGIEDHVTLAQYGRLWELAVVRCGRPDLPLRAAAALGTDSFGVVGFSLMTSPNTGAAFERLARFYRLLSTAGRWTRTDVRPSGRGAVGQVGQSRGGALADHVALVFEIESGAPLATRCAIEFALAEMVHFAGLLAGRRVPLRQARFPHPPPVEEGPYREFFAAEVIWNAAEAALVIPRGALELPLPKADPHLLAYFEGQAEALVRKGEAESALPLATLVRRRLIDALPSGPPALPTLARALGCSPRSLRRHLAEEGTSFHQLIEQTRSELASRYLRDPKLTISEIAYLVGFSELSPFLRAFRRWTGVTPGEFRQRAEAEGAGGDASALISPRVKAR